MQRLCQHVILFLTYMYMKRCVHQFQLLKCLFVKNDILFTVRLYDVNTFQCFVGRNPSTHHTLPVTTVSKMSNVSCVLMDISNLDSRYMYQFKYKLLQKTCTEECSTFIQVKWSPNANLYATGSLDGDIKVWDGVSNLVISTFKKAHDGEEVCSVTFSRNSKV